jgi:hypothetical protein
MPKDHHLESALYNREHRLPFDQSEGIFTLSAKDRLSRSGQFSKLMPLLDRGLNQPVWAIARGSFFPIAS